MDSKNKATKKEKAQKPTGYVQKNERTSSDRENADKKIKDRIGSEEPENPTDKV